MDSTCEFCCQLLNGKLCIDTPKFAFRETVIVVLQKIKLCKGQTWCYIRNFLYLHDDFLTISPDSARDGSVGGFFIKVQII